MCNLLVYRLVSPLDSLTGNISNFVGFVQHHQRSLFSTLCGFLVAAFLLLLIL